MFTHLHAASHHSVHYGTARPHDLVAAVASWGGPIAALTDRDTLSGAVRHIRACLEHGVEPVVGVELLVDEGEEPASTITVLAHGHDSGRGWAAVSRLISSAHMRGRLDTPHAHGSESSRPSVTRPAIKSILTDEDGLPRAVILLGPDSDVGRAVRGSEPALAMRLLDEWRALHGDVVIEAVCHLSRPGRGSSVADAAAMMEFAVGQEMPVVFTNAARYLGPDDYVTGDILDAIGLLAPLGSFDGQPNNQAWLKPPAKMEALLRIVVGHSDLNAGVAHDIRETTNQVAARCVLDPDGDIGWRRPKLPEPHMIGLQADDDPLAVLAGKARAATKYRYPYASRLELDRVHDRIDHELSIIDHFRYGSYFLTVAHIVDLIRSMGIRVQGRGSGAGSIVNFLLGVSPVDPIEHGLLVERFIGVARSTLPDVDIDVESARRHDIYRKVTDNLGSDRVTLLSMANRYRARGAVRDAGLALGLPDRQIDEIAKHVWRMNATDLSLGLATKPELAAVAEWVRADPRLEQLIESAARLDRMPRHLAMHPCGMILSDENLLSLTPIQPTKIGVPMSQFDKDDMDDLGLMKLDIIGIRMQSAIAHTLDQIRLTHASNTARAGGLPPDVDYISSSGLIDLESIPSTCEQTFDLIRSTRTLGCFQIESPGQRELLGRLQPDRPSDLVADIALFRPGPMAGNMVGPFIDAKHHPRRRRWLHPLLEDVTTDSYGTVIFHEHIMHILNICMGVGLAEADEIRRRLGKPDQVGEIEVAFRRAARSRRDDQGRRVFTEAHIDRVWDVVAGFGSFGFCKAHGAAFAITTWQTAWLKARYPAEFFAGLLEHDPGMYPKSLMVDEARRLGIPILPVDVTISTEHATVERVRPTPPGHSTRPGDLGIRLPLVGIRGMSTGETERILATRPHESIRDLFERAKPSRPTLRHLASIGALDRLAPELSRGEVIAHVRDITITPRRKPQIPGQGHLDLTAQQRPRSEVTEPSTAEQVSTDMHVLGIDTTGELLSAYRDLLIRLEVTPANKLAELPDRSEVLIAGVRVATQTPPMRSGGRVVFITVSDGTGVADTAFFDDAQEAAGANLFNAKLLLIAGVTRRSGPRGLSVTATNAWSLRDVAATTVLDRDSMSLAGNTSHAQDVDVH